MKMNEPRRCTWWLCSAIIVALLSLSGNVLAIVTSLNTKSKWSYPPNVYFVYFTNLSNLVALIWEITALTYHLIRPQLRTIGHFPLPSLPSWLATFGLISALYVTLTCIVFWSMLDSGNGIDDPLDAAENYLQHLVSPILCVLLCVPALRSWQPPKAQWRPGWRALAVGLFTASGLLLYFAISMTLTETGVQWYWQWTGVGHVKAKWYVYFFFDYERLGVGMMVTYILAMLFIMTGLGAALEGLVLLVEKKTQKPLTTDIIEL